MKVLAVAAAIFLFFPLESFCGEIISSGVEINDGIYGINIEINVDAKKEKVMEIFNDPDKLKSLSAIIREITVVRETNGSGEKKIKVSKLCFFLCMQTIQDNITETGDNEIKIIVPDQANFNPSVMYLEISGKENNETVIKCRLEAKPKFATRAVLIFVSKGMIENKLIAAGKKIIGKIEIMGGRAVAGGGN